MSYNNTLGKYDPTPVGFARVNKQPLDKYSVFNSIYDAIDYVKNGPSYVGQNISVNQNNTVSKFIIGPTRKLIPVYIGAVEEHIVTTSQLKGSEGYTVSLGNNFDNDTESTIPGTDKWLLIYNYNGKNNGNKTYQSEDYYNINMNYYSLLSNVDIYRRSDGKFKFAFAVNGSLIGIWTQSNSNFTASTATGKVNEVNGLQKLNSNTNYIYELFNKKGTKTGYGLFPKYASNNNISLYVNITQYLNS